MQEVIQLKARDGIAIGATLQMPKIAATRAVIIVQEIFGVNAHIRHVVNEYAERGFITIAPHFFDRIQTGTELDYSNESFTQGRKIVGELGFDAPLRDVDAAAKHLRHLGAMHIAVVGFCWGGVIAALAATRLGIRGVGYYGARIPQFLHEHPQAPLMLHFGAHDSSIAPAVVQEIEHVWPQARCYNYPAGHAFNRFGHADYHQQSAALAMQRTLTFLEIT